MQTRAKPNTFFTMAQDALQKQGIQVADGSDPSSSAQDSANAVKYRRRKRWQARNPLRDLRVDKGYTLEELAAATGLSPSYLSRLESGSRRLNADIIQKLSDILKCSPADLLPFANGPTSSQNVFPQHGNVEPLPIRDTSNQNAAVDFPVYGAVYDNGALAFDFSKPQDWIVRNPEFTGVSGAFAVGLSDNAFAPRYTQRDLLLAHPSKSLVAGAYVLVISSNDKAFLGRFDHWQSAAMTEGNFGPVEPSPEDVLNLTDFKDSNVTHSFVRKDIKNVYRIVGTMERN